MQYRVRVFVSVLTLLLFAGLMAAQNPQQTQRPQGTQGNQPNPNRGEMFEGKIAGIDASKHEFTVSDVRHLPSAGTTTGTPGTTGRPANTGTDRPGVGRTDQEKGGAAHMMTFRAANDARITLDGRSATFTDLKQGLFVRITSQPVQGTAPGTTGTPNKGTGTSGTQGTTGTQGPSAQGQIHTAERIDAFTKAPPGFGTGTGTTGNGVRP
jgi:hypothetical protein